MEVMQHQRRWDEIERYADALEDFTRAEPLGGIDFILRRARLAAKLGRGEADRSELEALLEEARARDFTRQARLLVELREENG